MFERFTDRARRVVVLAQDEARSLEHNYIGTEHILLGLIREGEPAAPSGGRPSRVLDLDRQLEQLATDDRYPAGPDRRRIEAGSIRIHLETWEAGA